LRSKGLAIFGLDVQFGNFLPEAVEQQPSAFQREFSGQRLAI
jgi:hypothetical protein